jgi:hypothetical protein
MDRRRRAVGMGDRIPDHFHTEASFGPLRDRDHFGLLMIDLPMPAEPFAPGVVTGGVR